MFPSCDVNKIVKEVEIMELINLIRDVGILPLTAFKSADDAVPVGNALVKGGLPLLEVTFRTSAAEESIYRLTKNCPELVVGAGTIHSIEQAEAAVKAGAKFILTAGLRQDVVDWCKQKNIMIIPGISSATDLEKALDLGMNVCKFFPASSSGGTETLKAFYGPFRQVTFVPTGGINENNMAEYLALPNVLAVGGSFVLPDSAISNKKWDEIVVRCRNIYRKLFNFEMAHVGINTKDADEAADIANRFCRLFDLESSEFTGSFFAGSMFEILKGSYLGKNGHIAILTSQIERAVAYLERKGFEINTDTLVYNSEGRLQTVYLKEEIGGFAIHLKQR